MAQSDMFLKITGSRQGAISGEAQDSVHKGEIDILHWTWAMRGNRMHGQATAKTTVEEIKFTKLVDSATTALMITLYNNEKIKSAILTVRKAGGSEPVEYMKITLTDAYVTSIVTRCEVMGSSRVIEEFSMSFDHIEVEYLPQGTEGIKKGGMTFEADLLGA